VRLWFINNLGPISSHGITWWVARYIQRCWGRRRCFHCLDVEQRRRADPATFSHVFNPIHTAGATQCELRRWYERSRRQSRPGLQFPVLLSYYSSLITNMVRSVTSDVIVEQKCISVDQNSRSQTTAVFSFQIVDRIRRQSSWASCDCVHTTDAPQLDSCVASVGGVYLALFDATKTTFQWKSI